MINVAWLQDDREVRPEKYLVEWNEPESRQTAFLRRWTNYDRRQEYETNVLHWQTVGAYYASVLGKNIPEEQKRKLYYAALAEFVKSHKCETWTDQQREEALRLARSAPGF